MRARAVGAALRSASAPAGPGPLAPPPLRPLDRRRRRCRPPRRRGCRRSAPAPRRRCCAWRTANATSVAYMLFSQTKITGRSQIAARLTPSWNAPLLTAPSPKKPTLTRSIFKQLEAVAGAGRLQDVRADDAGGAHQTDFGREEVHAAAPAARAACRLCRTARRSPRAAAPPWPARGRDRGGC